MNKARIAGVFYLLTIITGFYAYVANGRFAMVVGGIGGGCYLVVTVLLYLLFKPVNAPLSLIAAAISVATIVAGGVAGLPLAQSLVFFGVYCTLIGYLILKSTFAPRVVGALMVFAGLGWLTFLSPPLARALHPYILIPGLLGEGSLTIWLLFGNTRMTGVKAQ